MNNDLYVIYWKSKVTGKTGNGTAKLSKQDARILADELNEKYSELHHWIVKIN